MATNTQNKSLFTPVNGADVGTWDAPVNGSFTIIDAALGLATTLGQTAAGTYPLTQVVQGSGDETVVQYQCLIFLLTGTLTGNVTYQIPANVGGVWIVNALALNLNGFTCTFASATGGGTTVLMQSGSQAVIYCDGTNVRTNNPGDYNSVISLPAANTSLTPAQSGSFFQIFGASFVYTLPSPSITPPLSYTIGTPNASQTILTPVGSFSGPGGNGTATLVLNTGTVTTFTSDGANWIVAPASAPAGTSNRVVMPTLTDLNVPALGWAQYTAATLNIPAGGGAGLVQTISTIGSPTPSATNIIYQYLQDETIQGPLFYRHNFNNTTWSAWKQLVSLSQVQNAPPVGAGAVAFPGTVAIATTPNFTAPSNGILIVSVSTAFNATVNELGSLAVTSTLAGLVQYGASLPVNAQTVWYYLPMLAGQVTSITAQLSATASGFLSVTTGTFFLPLG